MRKRAPCWLLLVMAILYCQNETPLAQLMGGHVSHIFSEDLKQGTYHIEVIKAHGIGTPLSPS